MRVILLIVFSGKRVILDVQVLGRPKKVTMCYLLQVLYADDYYPLTVYFSEQKAYIIQDTLILRLHILETYQPITNGDIERLPRMKHEFVIALKKSARIVTDFDLIEGFEITEIPANHTYMEILDLL